MLLLHTRVNSYKKRIHLISVILVFVLLFISVSRQKDDVYPNTMDGDINKLAVIQTSGAYPTDMVEFAENYPQVIDYVYNYPHLKDKHYSIDLSKEAKSKDVPLLMQ